MMSVRPTPTLGRVIPLFLFPLLAVSAGATAEEVRNWPCPVPLQERISPEEVWGGPLPGALPNEWGRDPAIRQVVEYAANPENRPAQGANQISKFAEGHNGDREAALMAVYAGLLEETQSLRGFLIEGIRQYVLRARILEESVDRHDAALAALPNGDGTSQVQERRGYEQARFWDVRNLDDAMEEAEFLCGRYRYLDQKLRMLTETIRTTI